MLETLLILLLAQSQPAPLAAADSIRAAVPDTAQARRVVRQFPAVEVQGALLHDLRSSQTVHLIPGTVLRSFPVDQLADVLALQPGIVVQGEELHVRGGRAGETSVDLEGLSLNEPLRRRAMEVPMLALRSAELVTGAPDAQYGGGLAGVLNLRTIDPGDRLSSEWLWQTDGRRGTSYDRVAARIGAPLPALGLGLVTAADVTLDDTWLPNLRSVRRHDVLGASWGWRAENRLLGYVKLAPIDRPQRLTAQVLVGRQIHRPYNKDFSVDGWIYVPASLKVTPTYSPDPQPGFLRYRAADHVAITDDRQLAALLKSSGSRGSKRGTVSVGWLRFRTLTSPDARREDESASHRPRYGNAISRDRVYSLWGDYPLYRESASDVVTLRADGEITKRTGAIQGGVGLTHDDVSLLEMDWMPFAGRSADPLPFPVDSIRSYHARAPGAFAYVQGRWQNGGMVLNGGLRTEYFTPGDQATSQTLPGEARGIWSFGPRLGIAYPISLRDVFSLGYVRVHQAPGRDYLYDRRIAIGDRVPLGNPALEPSLLISYEAAVKHVFGLTWALQSSVFYRDVFGQIGTLDAAIPEGVINLRYDNSDESHALGFEWSVIHASGERRRIEAHYGYMHAWGNESRPEGDPYGPVRTARTPPTGDTPLSWDRRHTFLVSGVWEFMRRWSIAWSSALWSPLPWTPKPRRAPLTDLALVNSRRLQWIENTNVNLEWSPPHVLGLRLGVEARNLFDYRSERAATLDGFPNPTINTAFDDYGAYRAETGLGGGAYWSYTGQWVPVHDPRLTNPPREVRASVGARW